MKCDTQQLLLTHPSAIGFVLIVSNYKKFNPGLLNPILDSEEIQTAIKIT